MIVDKKTLSKLKEFGLNSYESKVWTALLTRGISTAGELSDIANVPRSRSYDVLESLEKKGFVVMKLGKPIKYIAVPPEETIDRVKKRIKQDAEEQSKILEELKDSELLNELIQLHNQGVETQDPSELTGSIKGRDNILNHLEYQVKSANQSVYISTTEKGLKRKTQALLRQMKKAKDRGVSIRVAAPITDANKEFAKQLSDYAEVIDTKENQTRMCLVDDEKLTLMLTDDDKVHPSYDLAVWLHSPYLAKNLMGKL